MTENERLSKYSLPEGKLSVVLDTDTYNEIDDQFALVYALLNQERIDIEAVVAAPFSHERVRSPAEGMRRSYEEIVRIYGLMGVESLGRVFPGAESYLADGMDSDEPAGVRRLIELALQPRQGLLYVVGIATPTNIAWAIQRCPDIIDKVVVVWLGGHAYDWHTAEEFNLKQDLQASRILFDSGVPLIHIPCRNVANSLVMTDEELAAHLPGHGAISDYLHEIFTGYLSLKSLDAKVIWDIANVAYLVNPEWVSTESMSAPELTDEMEWKSRAGRHLIATATHADRDAIMADFFRKVKQWARSKTRSVETGPARITDFERPLQRGVRANVSR